MSLSALNWTFKADIRPASRKLVALAMADCAGGGSDSECYPSTETLENKTSLDRKTIIAAIDELEVVGILTDTGRRVGRTGQVKVYRFSEVEDCEVRRLPKTPPFENQRLPFLDFEGSQKREGEGSQKRDTEPSEEPSEEKKKAEHPVFGRLWSEAFQKKFGEKYLYNGAKDGSAASRLLKLSGKSPEELIRIAQQAWTHPQSFWSSKASTIALFASHLNEITVELQRTSQPAKPDLVSQEIHRHWRMAQKENDLFERNHGQIY